ncbi:MAG: S41 family peptidase [Deltaproteobacteria bacterium]|nr:MAG: S41 family peptidase [Deltaproteobacteria bacterium]
MRRYLYGSVALLAAYFAGALSIPAVHAASRNLTYEKLGIFTRVLTYIENNYVEEVNPTQLIYGAIKGMMSTLDPHSVFMTPEEYEEMKIDTGGEFGGVGLEVTRRDGEVVVVTPLEDTPAMRAGLLPGDIIVEIDGRTLKDLTLPEAVRLMRGAPGSKVALTILRKGFKAPRTITVVRDHIRVNPVSARLVGGYGVIKIKSFQDRTTRYLHQALQRLRREKGGELDGLVLDLRNNPGGLLDQAVSVADTWLSKGVIVSTRGRGSRREVQHAHAAGTEASYPMVVLVNGGSASASEIVAGALQDHGRAVIMGTRSFGKGSVQTVIDLEDGSGLKLTIARYYTPKGRSIQERGIVPDVEVKPLHVGPVEEEVTREEDLAGHIPPENVEEEPAAEGTPKEVETDFQLKAALDALRTWQIFKAGLDDGRRRAAR